MNSQARETTSFLIRPHSESALGRSRSPSALIIGRCIASSLSTGSRFLRCRFKSGELCDVANESRAGDLCLLNGSESRPARNRQLTSGGLRIEVDNVRVRVTLSNRTVLPHLNSKQMTEGIRDRRLMFTMMMIRSGQQRSGCLALSHKSDL